MAERSAFDSEKPQRWFTVVTLDEATADGQHVERVEARSFYVSAPGFVEFRDEQRVVLAFPLSRLIEVREEVRGE